MNPILAMARGLDVQLWFGWKEIVGLLLTLKQ